MKRFLVLVLVIAAGGFMFAQDAENGGKEEIGTGQIGIDTAQEKLKEVSVDKFEQDGFWSAYISSDDGYVTSRLFAGGPQGKEPVPDEEGLDIPDKYVLGIKVDFLHRGHVSFYLKPLRPIPIEGITKTISIWAVGRNFNHTLVILGEDFFGKRFELQAGTLNFQGWKQLTVAVPPQSVDARTGIVQRNYHYNNDMGIKITGIRVDCDPSETLGSYYLYLDDLRALTDLFAEESRDPDDMVDSW